MLQSANTKENYKARFENIIQHLWKSATWLYYMGYIYILGSLFLFCCKALQLYRVYNMNEMSQDFKDKKEQLQADFDQLNRDFEDEKD